MQLYDTRLGFLVRCVKDDITRIGDVSSKEDIKVFLNPANDRVYINCVERHHLKLQIYNVVGECVMQRELNNGTNEIDISSFTRGIYVIQLTGADMTIQRKLIKE